MDVSLFDYRLPEELIAQHPIEPRDASRLMLVRRAGGTIDHDIFHNLVGHLHAGDCLVVNETRVIPARLLGHKAGSGGSVELLLLRPRTGTLWEALAKPGRRLAPGTEIVLGENRLRARIVDRMASGGRLVEFAADAEEVARAIHEIGQVPLPPYIRQPLADGERYQTVYAAHETSVAAPTAGLHFTPLLLDTVRQHGVDVVAVRLTVGLDTFRPVATDRVEDHTIHSEDFEISEDAVARINKARERGGRVVAVGTTCTRVLETVAREHGMLRAATGSTNLFIYPGHKFKAVDALITNFHLPRSSLLMLASAFAGRSLMMKAYDTAIRERYRFFSFGDAMFIV